MSNEKLSFEEFAARLHERIMTRSEAGIWKWRDRDMKEAWDFVVAQEKREIEELKKKVEELEKENFKLRNCENCIHYDVATECELTAITCTNYNKWEIMK